MISEATPLFLRISRSRLSSDTCAVCFSNLIRSDLICTNVIKAISARQHMLIVISFNCVFSFICLNVPQSHTFRETTAAPLMALSLPELRVLFVFIIVSENCDITFGFCAVKFNKVDVLVLRFVLFLLGISVLTF